MAKISTGQSFNSGDQVTSTKLNNIIGTAFLDSDSITGTTLNLNNGQLKVATNGITDNELNTDSVTTAKIANDAVTYDKIQDVAASSVIGNTTASTATPSNVAILDEDTMASDSATALATQQSIKAYVDSQVGSSGSISRASGGSSTATTLTQNVDTLLGSVSLTNIGATNSDQVIWFNVSAGVDGFLGSISYGWQFFSPTGSTSWYLTSGYGQLSAGTGSLIWDDDERDRAGKAYLDNTYYSINNVNNLYAKFDRNGDNQLDVYLKRTSANNTYYFTWSLIGEVK